MVVKDSTKNALRLILRGLRRTAGVSKEPRGQRLPAQVNQTTSQLLIIKQALVKAHGIRGVAEVAAKVSNNTIKHISRWMMTEGAKSAKILNSNKKTHTAVIKEGNKTLERQVKGASQWQSPQYYLASWHLMLLQASCSTEVPIKARTLKISSGTPALIMCRAVPVGAPEKLWSKVLPHLRHLLCHLMLQLWKRMCLASYVYLETRKANKKSSNHNQEERSQQWLPKRWKIAKMALNLQQSLPRKRRNEKRKKLLSVIRL